MDTYFLIGLAGILACLYVWLGMRASRSVQSSDDYFLMGRGLTFLPLCLTLLATQLGGGFLLGAAQEAYEQGWIVLFYPAGASIGLIVLGMGFGARLRQLNVGTIAEIFEKVFGSRRQRLVASALSVVSFYLILVAQGIAARKFFLAVGVGEVVFVGFWLAFVAYTVMGGLKAVVDTDIIQALLILIGLIAAGISVDWSLLNQPLETATAIDNSGVPWSSWLMLPLLFMLIEQDMGQRCFAAKSPWVVRPAAIVAALVLFGSSAIAIGLGVLGRSVELATPAGSSVLIETIRVLTSPAVSLLFTAAIFMAIASTADSILCSISSNLAIDFLGSERYSERTQLSISRILTLVVGLGALAVGYLTDNVVWVLMASYELSICVLFVPVMAAILTKQPSKPGSTAAMFCGVAGYIGFNAYPTPLPTELLTLLLSCLAYVIASRLTQSKELSNA